MTAPAPRDELADLRRRAYGPDGAADDADLDRLQRLEDALRAADEDESLADRGRPDVDPAASEASIEPPAPAAPNPPAPRAPLREVLRRRRVLLVLIAIAIAAAIVSALWAMSKSDGVILRRVAVNDTAAQQQLAGSLQNYGLDVDSYVQFESFEQLAVWTARIPERGLRCLLIVDEQAASSTYNGLVNYSCTPEGLIPSVDVTQYDRGSDAELGERPVGSVARFVFLGDRVEVTAVDARDDPQIPTPAPR